LDIHTHQLIVNGLIPPEATRNPLFAARAIMQARYLHQIETELALPTRRMVLLSGEIKGVAGLREVGRMFFDGDHESTSNQRISANEFNNVYQRPSASTIAERISPNGQRRAVFFAGKGGVGKTVASCITAVWLARLGYKTLLLTTDPAAHIGDVLGKPVGDNAAPVEGLPNLWAAKIDPKAAAEVYKQRILDDARQRGRPEASIKVMAEELDSPCTEEMAAFDKFIDFASQADWQTIIFDTAPTGHTMRLIELPMDWSQQIDVKVFASVDTTAADDVAKRRFGDVIEMMRDPARSTFAFVMYPESTPILEAYRAAEELRTVSITAGLVVANFVIPAEQATTPFTQSRRAMQEKYLAETAQRFVAPVMQIPLLAHEVKGIRMLIELGQQVYGNSQFVTDQVKEQAYA
jgi:arsenite-transporting ATPase